MRKSWHVSRRDVLRGMGAVVALPVLEAMLPRSLYAASEEREAPRRMAFLMVPNGAHMSDWTPAGMGSEFELPYILEPLAKVKEQLLVISGLTHDKGRPHGDGAGDHARACASFLTGCQAHKTHGSDIHLGVSVDQIAAQQAEDRTRLSSLELGCEASRLAGNCDSGYSCAYSSNISWSSPNTPVAKEINPRLVFERLFPNHLSELDQDQRDRGQRRRVSILDYVAEDARQLKLRLGVKDQQKLDEYLTSIREVEQRLLADEREPAANPEGYNKPYDIPQNYEEHIRLMADMIVLAFQSDSTRICTMMLANEGSNRSYRFIGVPEGHHDLSHHGEDAEKLTKIREINRFHTTQLAYLLERLQSTREASGSTLLDSCMLVYGSGISDGNRHNNEELPIVLAGRGGGAIRSGRHERVPDETPMTNLFLSMLDCFGTPVDQLGDSTDRLHCLS